MRGKTRKDTPSSAESGNRELIKTEHPPKNEQMEIMQRSRRPLSLKRDADRQRQQDFVSLFMSD